MLLRCPSALADTSTITPTTTPIPKRHSSLQPLLLPLPFSVLLSRLRLRLLEPSLRRGRTTRLFALLQRLSVLRLLRRAVAALHLQDAAGKSDSHSEPASEADSSSTTSSTSTPAAAAGSTASPKTTAAASAASTRPREIRRRSSCRIDVESPIS